MSFTTFLVTNSAASLPKPVMRKWNYQKGALYASQDTHRHNLVQVGWPEPCHNRIGGAVYH